MPFFSEAKSFPHVRVFRATAAGEEDTAVDSERIDSLASETAFSSALPVRAHLDVVF